MDLFKDIDFDNIDLNDYDMEGYDPSRFDLSEGVMLDLSGRSEEEILSDFDFSDDDFAEYENRGESDASGFDDGVGFDASTAEIGSEVLHEGLGTGEIMSFSEDKHSMSIYFRSGEELTFLFPDAFEEGYLRLL